MAKKIIYILLILCFFVFLATSCLHRDIVEPNEEVAQIQMSEKEHKSHPTGEFKLVEINGREYLQARGEIGKYGGILTNSHNGS